MTRAHAALVRAIIDPPSSRARPGCTVGVISALIIIVVIAIAVALIIASRNRRSRDRLGPDTRP